MKKVATIFLALAMTVGATGCNFLVTNSQADLAQTIAKVDVTKSLKADSELGSVADEFAAVVKEGGVSTEIPKSDLIASYMSVGYSYVNSYGYSYTDTFNMLMDGLVNRKIMTQYAVAYYLKNNANLSSTGMKAYMESELAAEKNEDVKAVLSNHKEVLAMKYFLTGGKTEADKTADENPLEEYETAVYSLKKSFNASLDTAEANYIKEKTDEHLHEEMRTTPINANAETEEYYTTDYEVYTGRNAAEACGEYERVDGSTPTTRQKAYNTFLSNLQGYGLVKDGENLTDILQLNYYYEELASTLAQALINKYFETLQDEAIGALDETTVTAKYREILDAQQAVYEKDATAFDNALDSVSDNKFVLYGQQDFGFVYNILLPFSAAQERAYAAAKSKNDENGAYLARKQLLSEIEAKDLRTAWFCTDEESNYAYEVTEGYFREDTSDKAYLFFENNLTDTQNKKYKSLGQYDGRYPYNGTATLVDGEWEFEGKPLDIDGFLTEMKDYIEYVAADTSVKIGEVTEDYKASDYDADKDGVLEYNKFVYKIGQVEGLGDVKPSDYFNREKSAYKALSAVNELMFAYSTDTGCLNQYMGYVVSPYTTDFVGEFEYAAQLAVRKGVGSIVVAPSDYGWHIIYCTFKYNSGEVYGTDGNGFVWAEKDTEGTFSNLFYESLKSTSASNYTTEVQNIVLKQYKDSAKLITEAYQDLLDMDK